MRNISPAALKDALAWVDRHNGFPPPKRRALARRSTRSAGFAARPAISEDERPGAESDAAGWEREVAPGGRRP